MSAVTQKIRHWVAIVAVLSGSGCQSDVAPTTVPTSSYLEVQGPGALKVGDHAVLIALSVSDVSHSAASPAWSSDRPDVLSVSSDGVVTAHQPGMATVTATVGTKSGQFRIVSVPDVSGRWVGTGQTTIERIAGVGPVQSSPTTAQYYEIRIVQNADAITATDWTFNFLEALSGNVDELGAIRLSGSYSTADGSYQSTTDPFTGRIAAGHLSGSFVNVGSFSNLFGPQRIRYTTVILDAVRQ